MALPCPHCAVDLREVKAEASSGYLLLLDQCTRCGGIWCDRWELFPLSAAAAQRIDAVDADALYAPPAPSKQEPLACPRCRARMALFHDAVLPADARIDRCLNCEGLWLNRGELRRLKPLRASERPRPTPAEVERVASVIGPPRTWSTVTHLDDAMQERDPEEGNAEVGRELLSGAGWLALRALLRLLLHV
jgi:Zn-finger nucleic acid-binding protein